MDTPEDLIHRFYTAFQNKDYRTMQACYAEEASFNDPAFRNLSGYEAGAMWEMLIHRGNDTSIEYELIKADEQEAIVRWTARYSFGPKKRPVINRIQASIKVKDGKIIAHTDVFPFYTWARQALGLSGWLLGWTPYVKKKVQKGALNSLARFIAKKNE